MKPTHQKFAGNQNYLEYERLLKQLQDLNQAGDNDSEKADAVREKTEDLWYSFSEDEQERLDGLSADLYSFSNEEIAAKPTFDDEQELRAACDKAFTANDWESLLVIMRRGPQLFEPKDLADLRGRCWHQLGHFAPAYWFSSEAFRRDRANFRHRTRALLSLAHIDPRAARSEIEGVLVSEQHPPRVWVEAAYVLFSVATRLPQSESASLYEGTIKLLQDVLREIQSEPNTTPDLIWAYLSLACLLELSEKNTEARRAYDQAVLHYPESEDALLLRAWFLRKHDSGAAKRDLDLLIQQKTHYAEAYFFRAQQVLDDKDFQRCLELCDQALQRRPQSAMLPALWEWKAICHAELKHNPRLVRDYFRRASEADPFNENIRKNLTLFERRLAQEQNLPEYDIPLAVISSPAEFLARIAA
jgi:hypothetical protein